MSVNSKLQFTGLVTFIVFFLLLHAVEIVGFYLYHQHQLNESHQQLAQKLEHAGNKVEKLGAPAPAAALFNTLQQQVNYHHFSLRIDDKVIWQYQADSSPGWLGKVWQHLPYAAPRSLAHPPLTIDYQVDHHSLFERLQPLLLYQALALLSLLLVMQLRFRRIISRQLRRPVDELAQFVRGWTEADFDCPLPKVPQEMQELLASVEECRSSLGQKVTKLSHANQHLRRTAHTDPLTGLGNRPLFIEVMTQSLDGRERQHNGLLCLVHANRLQQLNNSAGHNAGDIYLNKIALCISQATERFPRCQLFRISGSDFVILLPPMPGKDIEAFANGLKHKLLTYQQQLEYQGIANCGIVEYQGDQMLSALMSRADTALSLAQSKPANAWHLVTQDSNDKSHMGDRDWQHIIKTVMEQQQIRLFFQPILPTRDEQRVYLELLARFYVSEGHYLPTHALVAMAQRHEQIMELDRIIVEMALRELKTGMLKGSTIGIKLNSQSVHNKTFATWLERLLLVSPELCKTIVFQLDTDALLHDLPASQAFIEMLQRCGSRCTLEKFGKTLIAFQVFKQLRPNFIKLDSELCQGIDDNRENRFYVRLLIDTAHQLRIRVIAAGVERQEERFLLESLAVDAVLGHLVAKPNSIHDYNGNIPTF